jgi:altronate dehydratase
MDVDAGRIMEGRGTLQEVGQEIFDAVRSVANGAATKSEGLGHQRIHPDLQGLRAPRSFVPAAS